MTKVSNKGIRIMKSLQSAQVGPLVQITVDNTPEGCTTGIAALKNKRQFIGIEVDQQTFEIARARLESISPDGVTANKSFLAA
jgi:hypothetical protein